MVENLKELIKKEEVTQEESLYILQQYIKIRKNVVVNPAIFQAPPELIHRQLILMVQLTSHATVWLLNNLDKIKDEKNSN